MDPDDLRELFSRFRPVDVRRMFSGAGIFADGLMFGLVVEGTVYLKVDAANEADFAREGLPAFSYRTKDGERTIRSYRRMPERLYDDPDELAQWAARAFRAAQTRSLPKHGAARKRRPSARK